MSKKYYEVDDEGTYFDGNEKKPKLIILLVLMVVLLLIVFFIFQSCSKNKSTNNYLGVLRVTNSTFESPFSKAVSSYNIKTTSDKVSISCSSESRKATVSGCNTQLNINSGSKVTHKITVTAENNSVRTYTLYIERVESSNDNSVHVASIKGSVKSNAISSSNVTLEAISDKENYIYEYQWYINDKEISGATGNKFIAKESGSYYVSITNIENNYSSVSDEYIVKIEKQKKEIVEDNKENNNYVFSFDVSGNPTKWSKSCTLIINVKSSNELASKPYSFDGGKTYQSSNSKTFTSNKDLTIVVKDIKGNTISKKVSITKIDSIKPNVSINASNKTNSSIVLNAIVSPSNSSSGYTYQWYKNDSKIDNATKSTYKATSPATYKVVVKTKSGLSSSAKYIFNVSSSNLTCPTLTVTNSKGGRVEANTWTSDIVYILIKPDKYTVSYDIYLNGTNNFNSISENYTYQSTYTKEVAVKLSGKGKRVVKIVVRDKDGNTKTCYSKAYFLQ